MSRIVTKYEIPDPRSDVTTTLALPVGGTIRHLEAIGSRAWLWVEAETNAPMASRWFWLAATGSPLPADVSTHVGTLVLLAGQRILHLYDRAPVRIACACECANDNPAVCGHDFQGWLDDPDGRGGSKVCLHCNLAARDHDLLCSP